MARDVLEIPKNRWREFSLRVESAEVYVKIFSAIVNIKTFKNAELILKMSRRPVWNVVLHYHRVNLGHVRSFRKDTPLVHSAVTYTSQTLELG